MKNEMCDERDCFEVDTGGTWVKNVLNLCPKHRKELYARQPHITDEPLDVTSDGRLC